MPVSLEHSLQQYFLFSHRVMATKTFLERDGLALVSDERDIMVSNKEIANVIAWCDETGVIARQVSTIPFAQYVFGVNLWRVHDDEQRAWFALRWS